MENNRERIMKDFVASEIDSIEVPKGLKDEMWSQVKSSRVKRRFPSKVIPIIAAIACLAILIPLGLSEIPFGSDGKQSNSGLEPYTNETVNISTVIGDEWKQVDIPGSNPYSVSFKVEDQVLVEIHQSVIQITTGQQESQTDILKSSLNESDTYQDFVKLFLEKHTKFSGISYSELDVTDADVPIYYSNSGEITDIFAVLEVENTPFFIYLTTNDPIDSIKEQKYYTAFLEILEQTKPLN